MRQTFEALRKRVENLPAGDVNNVLAELRNILSDIDQQNDYRNDYTDYVHNLISYAIRGAELFFWEWSVEDGSFSWEPKDKTFLGYAPDDVQPTIDWIIDRSPMRTRQSFRDLIHHNMLRTQDRFEVETQFVTKSGNPLWVEIRGGVTLRDDAGKPLKLSGTARDIQRRHLAEEQLRLQRDAAMRLSGLRTLEATLEELFNILMKIDGLDIGGCYLLSPDKQGFDLAHYSRAPRVFVDKVRRFPIDHPFVQIALRGKPWYGEPNADLKLAEEMRRSIGFRHGAIIPILHQNEVIGLLAFISCDHALIPTTTRTLIESLAVLVGNVIVRTIAEKNLRISEEKHRSLTNNINAGIFRTTPGKHGNFLEVNNTFLQMFGFESREELRDLHVSDLYANPDDRRKLNNLLLSRGALREFEVQARRKSGETFWASMTAVAVRDENDDVQFFDGVVHDITQHKRAAEELRESEEKFRSISENSLVAMLIVQDGYIRYGNKAFSRILQITPEEIAAMKQWEFIDLVHPDYREMVTEQTRKKLNGDKDVNPSYRFKALRRDGGELWFELYSGLAPYSGEQALLVTLVDITDRVEAQQRLAHSERRFRELFEKNRSMMCLVEKETGRIRRVNKAMQQVYGYPFHELEQMHLQDLHVLDNDETMPRSEKINPRNIIHARHRIQDGKIRDVEIHCTEIMQDDQAMLFAIISDVTDKLRMEEEIAKQQKLEAIGLLAGGIAHDFNNILMAILGNISLLKHESGHAPRSAEFIRNAEKGVQRAKKLANQLLTFAKGGAPIRETASVGDLLTDSSRFMLRGSGIACKRDIPDNLFAVRMDTGQMGQVVQNLLLNAQQAMSNGGTISISAANEVITSDHSAGLAPGRYVRISIRDEGHGIHPENVKRVFDPYFTTRDTGTGLGLSIVYSIVQRHDGAVSLESVPGVGSTFHIWLPAIEQTATTVKPRKQETIKGSGLVLFMDDEAMVRETAGEFLRYLGYDVVFAANGDQAVSRYREHLGSDKPVDVVVLDLTIPGGKGAEEAMKEILELDPKAKGIIVSGFAHHRVMHDYESGGFSGAISKPFVLSEFSQMIKQVVEQK